MTSRNVPRIWWFFETLVSKKSDQTYYSVLGVNPQESKKVISKSNRKKMVAVQPEKHLECKRAASEADMILQRAWNVLSNNKRRVKYDKKILRAANKKAKRDVKRAVTRAFGLKIKIQIQHLCSTSSLGLKSVSRV